MLPQREYLAELPRKRLCVGVALRDAPGQVLLGAPAHKDRWILPGGTVEAGR